MGLAVNVASLEGIGKGVSCVVGALKATVQAVTLHLSRTVQLEIVRLVVDTATRGVAKLAGAYVLVATVVILLADVAPTVVRGEVVGLQMVATFGYVDKSAGAAGTDEAVVVVGMVVVSVGVVVVAVDFERIAASSDDLVCEGLADSNGSVAMVLHEDMVYG